MQVWWNKLLKHAWFLLQSSESCTPLLTCACRCVTCSWIQLNVIWFYWQRAAHLSQRGAIMRGDGEIVWVGEVSQWQQAIMLHCGTSTAFLNHAVQLQLRGPIKHLTLIWERRDKHSENNNHRPKPFHSSLSLFWQLSDINSHVHKNIYNMMQQSQIQR